MKEKIGKFYDYIYANKIIIVVFVSLFACLYDITQGQKRQIREIHGAKDLMILINSFNSWKYDDPLDKQDYDDIKILVTYHRPAFLYQHRALLPMFAGADVAKEESFTRTGNVKNDEKAIKWMNKYLTPDNTGDNISYLNRRIGAGSVIYWACKNYDKLENPEHIGFMQFTKFFGTSILSEYKEYDIITGSKASRLDGDKFPFQAIFNKSNGDKTMNYLLEAVKKHAPNDVEEIKEYFNTRSLPKYFNQLFLMKKKIFFEYCDFIFPIMLELAKNKELNFIVLGGKDKRDLDHIMERVTSYFIYKKTQDKNVKHYVVTLFLLEPRNW
ncbi:MAG: DUF4422 domain-containing protein [Rickettsiales bacterium]|jgi:hypothetical protein|nr:DUF4422 domain-containing protein [Rickettsiales bacterium]